MATAVASDISSSAGLTDIEEEIKTNSPDTALINGKNEKTPVNGVQDGEMGEEKQDDSETLQMENGQCMNGKQDQGERELLKHELHNGSSDIEKKLDVNQHENEHEEPSMEDSCQGSQANTQTDESYQISERKTENELKNETSLEDNSIITTKTPPDNDNIPTRPPLLHRHSPTSKTHTGGCHKFLDEEARAEYMKIKSEVTGGAETSESEDEVVGEHSGSHTSPDAKTKAEYRKIKYEVTGEALTSESEDENIHNGMQKVDMDTKEPHEEWMDIFGNGLLKRRILREGKGRDTRPERGQVVMIRTAGRLEDGTAVDWNQSLQFILGDGEVIQAWDVGIALVELNEVCELVTDSRYAYGEKGRDGDSPIPPNAKITYEIELLAVRDGPDMDTMNDEERIKIGDKKKDLGNDLFSRGDYAAAINCYQRAIKYLAPSSDKKVQELKVKCWNNLAATQLKIKAYSAALNSCEQVLATQPDNVKALFRKGKVLSAQGELKEAISYIRKASQHEPTNKTIRNELANIKKQRESQDKQERFMYEKMVGGLSKTEKSTAKNSTFPWSMVVGAAVVVLGGIVAALYVNKH